MTSSTDARNLAVALRAMATTVRPDIKHYEDRQAACWQAHRPCALNKAADVLDEFAMLAAPAHEPEAAQSPEPVPSVPAQPIAEPAPPLDDWWWAWNEGVYLRGG